MPQSIDMPKPCRTPVVIEYQPATWREVLLTLVSPFWFFGVMLAYVVCLLALAVWEGVKRDA